MSALAFAKKILGFGEKATYAPPIRHVAGFEQAVTFMEKYPLPLLITDAPDQGALSHHRYPFMCIERDESRAVFEAHISTHTQIYKDVNNKQKFRLIYQSPVAAYDAFSDGRHGTSFHMGVEIKTGLELSEQKPVLNHLKEFQAYIRDQGYDVNLMQTTPDDFLKNMTAPLCVVRFTLTPEKLQSFVKLGRNLYLKGAKDPWAMRRETIETMKNSARADVRQVAELMQWDLDHYSDTVQ